MLCGQSSVIMHQHGISQHREADVTITCRIMQGHDTLTYVQFRAIIAAIFTVHKLAQNGKAVLIFTCAESYFCKVNRY